jgi:hypothetical protein
VDLRRLLILLVLLAQGLLLEQGVGPLQQSALPVQRCRPPLAARIPREIPPRGWPKCTGEINVSLKENYGA